MNKFSKYFAAFASLAVLASCSNDEPGNGGENKPVADGEKSYLTITLRDANDMSRADNTDGNYEYSEGNEGTVSKARFFFFDGAGVYAGQTTSDELVNAGDEQYNIEFKAKSVIALNNIVTSGGQPTYPKYMVTLLNVPQTLYTNEEMKNVGLADFSTKITTWGQNEKNGFVMASTSYLADDNNTNHSNTYYYATVLKPSDFAKSPELALANTQPVDVYVERLAARVRVTTVSNSNMFDVKATTFGAAGDNPDEAATNFKVRIDGWYLNGIQPESHLLKQLDVANWANDLKSVTNWNEVSKIASAKTEGAMWQWNKASDFRSFWGMSVGYNNVSNLTTYAYEGDTNATYLAIGKKDYCNENTTTHSDLMVSSTVDHPNQTKLTSVIVKATVGQMVDSEFKPVDLVEHNGIYFTDGRFIAYVLDIVNTKDQLNFYTETRTPSETEVGKDNVTYSQVTASDFELAGNNDRVYVAANAALATKTLYKKVGDKYEAYGADQAKALDDLDEKLKAATAGSTNTRGFKEGKMYYNIPIVHLNEPTYETTTVGTGDNQQTVNSTIKNWKEGSFGVVRNHSYDVRINSVKHLGNGVFDPTGETIKPDSDPEKEYWWLGATINILSWKIVSNNVDL